MPDHGPDANHSRPLVELPVAGPPVTRPDTALLKRLHAVSSATASASLHQLGIRHTFIEGPVARRPGSKVVGCAITLQFMPQREDIMSGVAQEEAEQYSALWAVLETIQPGDVLTIQAWADPYTGCIGEQLASYFQQRGGAGIVVDGYVRDWPRVQELDLPVWARGATPNYASQSSLIPWAFNTPIACSRVLVIPGDIVIADDDGAVLVPIGLAEPLLEKTADKEAREAFSRQRLADGGDLRTYYPLSEKGRQEFEQWKRTRSAGEGVSAT
jgi:regulator of RNase E activity RraA